MHSLKSEQVLAGTKLLFLLVIYSDYTQNMLKREAGSLKL
jgi:hypothetical protein